MENVGTIVIAEEEGVSKAIGEAGVRRIPIVDESGKLAGVVTLDDLVVVIGEQHEHVADTIGVQSPECSP